MPGDLSVEEAGALGRIEGAKGLRILSVEPVLLSYRYPAGSEQEFHGGWVPGVTMGLARVVTEGGVVGLGETYAGYWGPEHVRTWIPRFAEVLVGRDAGDIAGCWTACAELARASSGTAVGLIVLSAVESALWDACGKALGVPCHALLGGAVHEALPRYASGGTQRPDEWIHDEIASYAGAGFVAAKIRGGVSPEVDLARVEAAAAGAADSGLRVALDQVQGGQADPWSADQAIVVGRTVDPFGLLWIEEPCHVNDLAGYRACRDTLSTPIAGGEPLVTYERFARFLEGSPVDVVQPDASHAGGMLEIRKAAADAAARGVEVAVHAWAGSACLMANYHVGFASPATTWLEFPPQPNPFVTGLMVEPLRIENGRVHVPTAPGLGLELTTDFEAAHPYDPGCCYQMG